jgi:hypothetical protein
VPIPSSDVIRSHGGFLKPSPDVICRDLGDAGVLIHLGTNQIFELNVTGYRVWQLLQEGLDRDGIESALLREFAVDPEQLRREISELLTGLAAKDLIVDR